MFIRKVFSIALCILTAGCALPTDAPKSSVPEKELLAASLMTEGNEYHGGGRFIEAEMTYRRVLMLYPESDYAKSNLALTLQAMGSDLDESRSLYEELIALRPLNFDYQFGLANTLIKQKRYEYAVATLEELIRLAEENLKFPVASIAARNLAVLHFSLGREEEAICASHRAYLNDSSREQQIRHTRLLLATGHTASAERFLTSAIKPEDFVKLVGNDPFLFYVRSAVAFANKDYMLSLKLARDALDFAVSDQELKYELDLMTDVLLTKLAPSDSEEHKVRTQTLVKDRKAEGAATLYWPSDLLVEVAALKAGAESAT